MEEGGNAGFGSGQDIIDDKEQPSNVTTSAWG